MKRAPAKYVLLSVLSFLVLAGVQVYLVHNTYQLKKQQFYYAEKEAIVDRYSRSVMNDLLFAGGKAVFDSVLGAARSRLETTAPENSSKAAEMKRHTADLLFRALRQKESITKLIQTVKRERGIMDSLSFALVVERVDLRLEGGSMPLYPLDRQKEQSIENEEERGIRIGGTLQTLDDQNRIVHLSVGNATEDVSRLVYTLYVAPVNRQEAIFRQMGLTLLLALGSVLFVVVLFFVTFRNWVWQKKESQLKSDFINNITHEFHTPLTAIRVAAKSLRHERIIRQKEEVLRLSEVIERQSGRLQGLIGQVLGLPSLEEPVLHREDVELDALLDEVLADYRLSITEQDVHLHVEKGAGKERVALDPFSFSSLLTNLLNNAVRFNDAHPKKIHVVTEVQNGCVQLQVRDNGIGMSPETQVRAFEKFYQQKGGATSKGGLGLGLYYVQQIVQAHGWTIRVTSAPGEGTTFLISMPKNKVSS